MAARSTERGWQINKSLSQCNQHMLDNRIGCDVTFEIESPDGSSRTVLAHKYMLVSRSPVFEAMLYGPALYTERDDNIVITDIEAVVFEEMLRYIYTENCTITAHNVLYLMMAAKKYLLDQLVDQCMNFLENSMNVENVCTILEHSVQHDEKKLVRKCLDYIGPNAKDVVRTEAFKSFSQPVLRMVLKKDDLYIEESALYDACIDWAKHNLNRSEKPESDENLRAMLGDCIHQIRFHEMAADDLCNKVGFSGILEDKEAKFFFMILTTKEKSVLAKAKQNLGDAGFNLQERIKKTVCCLRFSGVAVRSWYPSGCNYAIYFNVNHPISVTGVSLYGGCKRNDTHSYTVSLRHNGKSLTTCKGTLVSDGTDEMHPVSFERHVKISPNTEYEIILNKTGPDCWYNDTGKTTVVTEGIQFTFKHSANSAYTSHTTGLIPGLLFQSSR